MTKVRQGLAEVKQSHVGATVRVINAADKSLPKENDRLVKQVIGGLTGLTSAACVVSAYLAAEKARKEKHVLNQVLVGAAALGTAAAAVKLGVQSYDLFRNREQQPQTGTDKYLSQNQLSNVIYGKIAIHQSLSVPNRLYEINYNLDNTFQMKTIENGNNIGITRGTYNLFSKDNIGYIDITYLEIKESPYLESPFNKENPNNVYITMKNLLGPFTIHRNENRSGNILEYGCFYSTTKLCMTVF